MAVSLTLLISVLFQFGIVGNLVTSWIMTTAYAEYAVEAYGLDIESLLKTSIKNGK